MGDRMIARFEYGARRFEFEDGRIKIAEGFAPPTTLVTRVMGQGEFETRVDAIEFEPRAWGFTVHVDADSETEARRVLEGLQAFLDMAGNPKRPEWFAFRDWGAGFPFEPTWGQFGALMRLRVLQGTVEFGSPYYAVYAGNLISCPVSLTIDALSYGLWQELATAGGGVFEEWAGRNGKSVGLRVASNPSGVENHFLNPIFGNSTWNTGWTAAGNVVASQNTDEFFRLFGYSSARLVCFGSSNNTFTQTLNVGNTNTHTMSCYARLRDGGVISSAVMSLRYGVTTLTTRYLALEGGWYFLCGQLTGIASGQVSGVILAEGVEAFVDGFQLEESTFPNPLVWGDLPGAAWSGTVHASTTTGAGAGKVQVPATRWLAEGSVQAVVQCMARSANLANGSYYIFQDSESDLALFYDKTNGRWTLTDGTTSINLTGTFTEGDVFVFHGTWIQGMLALYVNGVLSGTAIHSVPSVEASSIYLGSTAGSASQGPWVLLGFDVYGVAMAVADVTVFYTQAAGILFEEGTTTEEVIERISPIPWLWTKDGDDVVDNCDDSTRDNWCLIGGVGGSVEAETEWLITPSQGQRLGYWLMLKNLAYADVQKPGENWYFEFSGTADVGGSSGDAFQRITVDTVGDPFTAAAGKPALMEGGFDMFVRCKVGASQDMLIWGRVPAIDAYGDAISEQRRVAMTTAFRWFYVGRVYYEFPKSLEDIHKRLSVRIDVACLTGTEPTDVDFTMAVNGRVMRITRPTNADIISAIKIAGREAMKLNPTLDFSVGLTTIGDEINLVPDKYNIVWFVTSDDGETHVLTETGTFTSVRVRPRWVLQ